MKWWWKNKINDKTYKKYVKAQVALNIKKFDCVWVYEKNIEQIVEIFNNNIDEIKFTICHGCRNGKELEFFKKYLPKETKILGTDIAKTANDIENMIQWDFHKTKEEWIDNVDVIYSNSIDHTYDPYLCLDKWMSCVKKENGICVIHLPSSDHGHGRDRGNCFGATAKEYEKIFTKKYSILHKMKIDKPVKNQNNEIEHTIVYFLRHNA